MGVSGHITRRGFLCGAGIAAAGALGPYIIPASALGKNGTVAPSNRIALGFIGLGTEGRSKNLKRFMAEPETQVVALCDVHRKRLDSAHLVMQTYAANPEPGMYRNCFLTQDWREVVARNDIDAVVISTPDHWHVLPALAAVRAGKDIFVEKPLSLTIREGRVLADAVTQHNRISQTASENRSMRSFLRACEFVRNGIIGKLQAIRTEIYQGFSQACNTFNPPIKELPVPEGFDYDMWLGQAPEAPYTPTRCHCTFRYIRDYAGGNLCDWGAHINDVAQWGNDTERSGPVSVEGRGKFAENGLFNSAVEWELAYEYANGVKLFCRSSRSFSVRFEGTEGWVQADWSTFEASSRDIARAELPAAAARLRTCAKGEHRDFLNCVKSREEAFAPVEVGHRTASLNHLGNICLLLGRKLQWDPDKEQFLNDDEANAMVARPMRAPWKLEA